MMAVLIHDRLRADAVDAYDHAHRAVPEDVYAAILGAGVDDWTIWRSGADLFQLIVCEDWQTTEDAISSATPMSWKRHMRGLVDPDWQPPPPHVVSISWRLRSSK